MWLTKKQIAKLFGVFTAKVENNHEIFKLNLLCISDDSRFIRYTDTKGRQYQIEQYRWMVVLFLSFRIAIPKAKLFREWFYKAIEEKQQNIQIALILNKNYIFATA